MKYKAYEFTLVRYVDGGYSVRWGIRDPFRDPNADYHYHHRVGGPACAEYSPDGICDHRRRWWGLDGTAYYTTHEYQKALEAWLG